MGFQKFSKIFMGLEILGSLLISGYVVYTWLTVRNPIQYIYNPPENDTEFLHEDPVIPIYIHRQIGLEGVGNCMNYLKGYNHSVIIHAA